MNPLRIALITQGDPERLTGGFLYHKRLVQLAPDMDAHIETISLPDWPFPTPLLALPKVLAAVHRGRFQAVLLDSLVAAYVAPVLGLAGLGMPVIGMLHQLPGGIDHSFFRSRIQFWLDRLAYRHCRALIACSDCLAQEVRGLHPKVVVATPGSDPPVEIEPVPHLRAGRKASLLCVANWQAVKDIESLLEALASLPAETATLHLVGEQNLHTGYGSQVLARITAPDLRDRVQVHGPLSPAELRGVYAGSDVFVLASKGETYGSVYAEAMTWGLPVVGWRSGNLPNLVGHEKQGLLVEPGDVPGLASALRRLCEDAPLRLELGHAAREEARQFPNWEDTSRTVLEVVRHAL